MDWLLFVLLIIVLIGIVILLRRSDARTKNKYRKAAYDLLEKTNPDPKQIKDTIRYLRLYGGRWRKDKEFIELVRRLLNRLDSIEKAVDK
jgi:hypothetical protein